MNSKDLNRVEIIKKDGVIQLRVSDGNQVSSYIIEPTEVERGWLDNIFSMSTSMINRSEQNG